MPAPLREWNASEVAMSFAGIPITGYADGEFVTIEPEADDYGDTNGTDGETTRWRTNDLRATVTFKIMQTSSSHPLLMAMSNVDLAALNGAGVGALQIANLTTGERYEAPEAWIKRRPNVPMAREVGPREWIIRCAALVSTPGTP
jgi:hypothetical protein